MNDNESVDAESAYGSETSSNSNFIMKKDTFKIEKPTSKRKTRCQWLKHNLREYMILEAVFFLILVFLLITCFWIISQNQETQRMILSMQSQLNSFQKESNRKNSMNTKEEAEKENENKMERTKATLEDVLKEIRMESGVELKAIQSMINSTSHSEKADVQQNVQTVVTNFTNYQYNAANLISGASIDASLSSSSSLNPIFGFDQSSLVLVDRPEPPVDKAWCTSDKNPVLTVNLGYYINPTAVSYQHSKWNRILPDDAPKMYSVEACLDNNCITRKPLFSRCEYNQHGLQEQICNNTSNDSLSSPVVKFAKLQFRFHKNHGNTERTCVSLVRVYSKTEVVKEKKLRWLGDTTTCLNLNHHYHNNPMIYKFFTYKTCSLLYSKGCCQECPECCEECDIKDVNHNVLNEKMLRITSQLRSIQKPSRKDFMDNVWKEIMKDYSKENAEKTFKNTFEMLESKEALKEHQMKPVVQLKQNQPIINSTEKLNKPHAPPIISTVPTNSTFKQFNAASLIASSTIDKSLSEK